MKMLQIFLDTATAHEGRLSRAESYEIGRSQFQSSNGSGHLTVKQDYIEVELLVWESGDAELNFGQPGAATFEHHNVSTGVEMSALVERVLEIAGL